MLTDIESSTGLLRKLGDRYAHVLEDVRGIIRDGVLRAGGREVEVRADEFFAVFERVAASIEAAVTIQRAMSARPWTDDLDVRVRIGIHSGLITLTDGGYIGLSVHTAARVCSAGHGGQIVVTEETRAAIEEASPANVRFRSLGEHHLPGLPHAELLFQLEADGLLTDFPPLRRGTASSTEPRP
jgi:class 3 adenylate cyclase